jgi:hypothetical protein
LDYKYFDMNFLENTSDVSDFAFLMQRDAYHDISCHRYYSELSLDTKVSIGLGAKFLQFFQIFLLYSNRCTCPENAGSGAQTCKERVSIATCS